MTSKEIKFKIELIADELPDNKKEMIYILLSLLYEKYIKLVKNTISIKITQEEFDAIREDLEKVE